MKKVIATFKYFYRAFVKDEEYAKFVLSESFVNLVYPKYKFSEFGRTFLNDDKFISDYYLPYVGNNFHSLDRKYFLKELMKLVRDLEGDTAECGVYLGASSYLICDANSKSAFKKIHHLFDSFEGLSAPAAKDGQYWTQGDLVASLDVVKNNLKMFDSCQYFKGWIPSKFSSVTDRKFSFVHIDVDLYQPTLDSITFFYERLVPGGLLICDDYGFTSCPGARAAMDEFFASRREKIIHVPTGQALVIKFKE